MRLTDSVCLGVLFWLFSGPVLATSDASISFDQGKALAKKNVCLGCHQVDAKRVGPGFTQVAERYRGQPGAAAYLVQIIHKGGRGKWGAIPMPAQNQVSDGQAKALAQWILALEPESDAK